MSRKKLKKRIKNVVQEIDSIVDEMIHVSHMVDGYFGTVYRKCGKPNCWCSNKEKKGHPFMRLVFSKQNKLKTKGIPQEDKEWVKKMTENYRNYKQNFQKLRQYEKELNELLKKFEFEVKTKTRDNRDYLKLM